MFHLEPPAGFTPFNPRGEITVYKRNFPHWRQSGASYFVTFRQKDSLPASKLEELKSIRQEWIEKHFPENEPGDSLTSLVQHKKEWEELYLLLMTKTERWIDQGLGSCVLQHNGNRQIVRDALAAFDGDRYEIGACVVMPNHVHAVIRPLDQNYPLNKILHSRKTWTARKINESLNQKGPLWQEESFDRIIRDPAHLWKTIQYIGNNPKLAGLDRDKTTRWIRPEWQEAGWDFVDE